MVGELIEADHILFQVTPGVNLDMLRAHARVVLDELMADPSRFAEVAREQSNCPSAAVGGSLGQLGRGDTVPEFERAVFALPAGGLLPQLLETRHGLHIVRVTRRIEGRMLAYEQVAQQIAHALSSVSGTRPGVSTSSCWWGAPASRASTWTTASPSACSAAERAMKPRLFLSLFLNPLLHPSMPLPSRPALRPRPRRRARASV